MKKSLFILTVVIFFLLSMSSIYACEAMLPLGVEKTVEQADLIIIGQKVAQGPIGEKGFAFGGEPIWVDIKILRVLKGNSSDNPIRIKTNSPCGYGFPAPIDNNEYLMFFSWNNDSKSFNRVGESGESLLMITNDTIYYPEQDSKGVYRQKEEKIGDFVSQFSLGASSALISSPTRPMSFSCPFIGEITNYEKEMLNEEITSRIQNGNVSSFKKENFTGEHIKLEIMISEKVDSRCNFSVGQKINGTITFWDHMINPSLITTKNILQKGALIQGEIDSWDLIMKNLTLANASSDRISFWQKIVSWFKGLFS